jgi:hypothetical protein
MKRRKRVIDAASESIRQSVTGEERVEMMENERKMRKKVRETLG